MTDSSTSERAYKTKSSDYFLFSNFRTKNRHVMTFKTASILYNRFVKHILIILIILLALATYGSIFSFQTPESFEKTLNHLEYLHTGDFNYTVIVKPSTLYNNESVITMDNKTTIYGSPISRKLATDFWVGFRYNFSQILILTNLTNINFSYEVSTILNYSDITKVLTLNESIPISIPFQDVFHVNISNLDAIIGTISLDTGISTSNFSYQILPKITLNATFREGERIVLIFTPKFSLNFNTEKIRISGINNELSDRLRYLEEIPVTWNQIPIAFLRRSYLIALFTLSLFILMTTRNILLQMEAKKSRFLYRNIKNLLVEVVELPLIDKQIKVKTKSLNDLINISNLVQEPILHKDDSFIVFHKDTSYQFLHSGEEKK